MSKKMKVLKKVTIHPSSQFCPFLGPLAPAAAVKVPPGPHPALPGVPCRPLAWSVDQPHLFVLRDSSWIFWGFSFGINFSPPCAPVCSVSTKDFLHAPTWGHPGVPALGNRDSFQFNLHRQPSCFLTHTSYKWFYTLSHSSPIFSNCL